jgi:poly(A) polymerase
MRRLLAAPDPAPAVAAMQATGVLARILPGAEARALGPLVHLEPPYAPDWIRRLAALGGAEVEDALRLSREEARRLSVLRDSLASNAGPAEIAYRHGARAARDAVLLCGALLGAPLPSGWEDDVSRGAAAKFPVHAADLMPGLSGAALGQRLREIEDRWIASGFGLSREQLLA